MSNNHPEGASGEGNDNESLLPLETVFQALVNQRRRTILYYLTTCTHPIPFEELVDKVAAQESEMHVTVRPAGVYERVVTDLHHTQLPKLAQWGIIKYNKESRLITVAETLRPLDEYLRLAKQHDQQVEPLDHP